MVKFALLVFIIVTGFVVLGGGTKVENPKANFQNSFSGTKQASAYGLTNALYRIIFSYGGYNNAFNVVNEIKVCFHPAPDQHAIDRATLTFIPESSPIAQEKCYPRSFHRLRSLYIHQRILVCRRLEIRFRELWPNHRQLVVLQCPRRQHQSARSELSHRPQRVRKHNVGRLGLVENHSRDWQTGCLTVDELLGFDETFRHSTRSLCIQVGYHCVNHSGYPNGRCFQLQ